MNLYLKYRPRLLAELDITAVREALNEALAAKSLPHAWLLTGPKGTGKTSAARIIAKSVNCLKKRPGTAEPCNRCEACAAIAAGTSFDVLEIDAASNRGIDDIRELKDRICLAPSSLKQKVYIIDEAHMLTKEAFNALLKTLEEPPAHALFILCTTEPEKLPETVISRCRVIRFNRAGRAELSRALKRVIKAEKLAVTPEDIAKIVLAADGSFRDAVKVLEQLAAAGKKISSRRVAALLEGGLTRDRLDQWLIMLSHYQAKEALVWLQTAWNEGVRPKQLALAGLERLRRVWLGRFGVSDGEDIPELGETGLVKQLAERLLKAAAEIKTAAIETLPLELLAAETGITPVPTELSALPKAEPRPQPVVGGNQPQLKDQWSRVLEAVRPLNHSLEALLRATEPLGYNDGCLEIKVYYQFHKDRLEEERYRLIIETAASKIMASKVKIRYMLAQKADESELVPAGDEDIIKTAEEIFGIGGD